MAKSFTVPCKMPLHLEGFWSSDLFMVLNPRPLVHIIVFKTWGGDHLDRLYS